MLTCVSLSSPPARASQQTFWGRCCVPKEPTSPFAILGTIHGVKRQLMLTSRVLSRVLLFSTPLLSASRFVYQPVLPLPSAVPRSPVAYHPLPGFAFKSPQTTVHQGTKSTRKIIGIVTPKRPKSSHG